MPARPNPFADSKDSQPLAEGVAPYNTATFTKAFTGELRSDHAGETGAVWMYRGVLRASRDPAVLTLASAHLRAEERHLAFFQAWLPRTQQSRLLGLWKLFGFLVGWVTAKLGPNALYTTIDAVEDAVVDHYQRQLNYLDVAGSDAERTLGPYLDSFLADEAHHQADARHQKGQGTLVTRGWQRFIGWSAVWAAKAATKW